MSAPGASGAAVGLLDAIVRDALDPSYAEADQRRRELLAHPERTTRTPARWTGVALIAVAGVVAGLAVSLQHQVIPQAGAARTALAGDANARGQQVKALERAVAAQQKQIAALQQQRLSSTAAGRALEQRAAALAAAAGQTPLRGPGVMVTVSDVAGAGSTGAVTRPGASRAESGVVTDRDLQALVNALWAAGAQGIAVGGVRLGPQTAIRTAGQTILVDFRALRSPYAIQAVGGPELATAISVSPAFAPFRSTATGVHPGLTISPASELSLPATGPATVSQAQPVPPAGGHS